MSLVRGLYSVLMWLAQPLLRRKLRRRAELEPGYAEAVDERFGRYDFVPEAGPRAACLWVHAVSLGETRAAAVLLGELRRQHPGLRVVLTHGTATGRAEGQGLLLPGDCQVWQPWDTPAAVRRFLSHFQPVLGVLLETEVWPNWVAECQRAAVPLLLVNARLSAQSARQAKHLAWLARPAYAGLAGVWAQTEVDAQRLRDLGAKVEGVTGNLKFDAQPDPALLATGQQWRLVEPGRPVCILASSREGEEQMLLQALAQRQAQETPQALQQVQWLIVPRHPQRFDEVAALARRLGWQVSRRSTWGERGPPQATLCGGEHASVQAPMLWLGDSLGEMPLYYGLSRLALLGGSFAPLGGQNLIEAAACGCPVLMGPHTFNFAEAAQQALAAGAAWRVADLPAALDQLDQLMFDSQRLLEASAAARQFAATHRGAAARTVQAVLARWR